MHSVSWWSPKTPNDIWKTHSFKNKYFSTIHIILKLATRNACTKYGTINILCNSSIIILWGHSPVSFLYWHIRLGTSTRHVRIASFGSMIVFWRRAHASGIRKCTGNDHSCRDELTSFQVADMSPVYEHASEKRTCFSCAIVLVERKSGIANTESVSTHKI